MSQQPASAEWPPNPRTWDVHHNEKRTALVIGNGHYAKPNTMLASTIHDARAVAVALSKLGFMVIKHYDADKATMEVKIKEFENQLRKRGGVALFYYSGHGGQVDGTNMLLGVDSGQVSVGNILDAMGRADPLRLRLLMLDACRSPLGKKVGFVDMKAPPSTIISFAAEQGKYAYGSRDGSKHGRYSGQVLKHINTPGLSIEDMLKRVGQGLAAISQRLRSSPNYKPELEQNSSFYSKFYETFYFAPKRSRSSVGATTSSGACGDRNPSACYSLAVELEKKGDYKGANRAFRRACDDDHISSCVRLGRHYETGMGGSKRSREAIELYERACKARHSLGCLWLWRSRKASDPVEAARHFTQICRTGPPRYCLDLARMYLNGWGVPRDHGHARGLLERACADDNGEACRILK